jgi:hypothetical protein
MWAWCGVWGVDVGVVWGERGLLPPVTHACCMMTPPLLQILPSLLTALEFGTAAGSVIVLASILDIGGR